ncbi:MAG TPA: cytochrome c biogenesis protein CcsA, partial [Pirellulales bacterium]|nr:cytochrome c biogenesis protein CcsA [Pirellulales bacterium]
SFVSPDTDKPQKIKRWTLSGFGLLLGTLVGALIYWGNDAALSGPSMRILWQLMKGGFAGLVLLAGCVLLFRKRAGIVLLHAGVGLMMLNELVVYGLHVEGIMQIREGQTVNYVQDIRSLELAVVDSSSAEHDNVVAIPVSLLQRKEGKVISDPALPFDIKLVKFLQNADLRSARAGEENLADAGQGVSLAVDEARPSSGTDMGGGVDMSAAYVKFLAKDSSRSLGTHLLGLYPALAHEQVSLEGKNYHVEVRFKRDYKPYAVHLIDVRFDKYMGTNTPRNYSSEVRLIDPSRNEDRQVKIWMNNPLRYAGETFYQSSFNVDPVSRQEMTGLQVVTNTGWMIPYVGCMIVATGMLAHFMIVLVRFLRRQTEVVPAEPTAPVSKRRRRVAAERHSIAGWAVPLVLVAAAGAWLAGRASPRIAEGQMRLDEFGRLPVAYEGRMKPFDTLARNALRVLSDRDYFTIKEEKKQSALMRWLGYQDEVEKKQPAVRWLLDLVTDAPGIENYEIVRIQSPEVLQLLDLEPRHGFRYSLAEIGPKYGEFRKQAALVHDVKPPERNGFQKKIAELERRLHMVSVLRLAFDPPRLSGETSREELQQILVQQKELVDGANLPLAIPPAQAEGQWLPYGAAWMVAWLQAQKMGEQPNQAVVDFSSLLTAYAKGDAARFNREVERYRSLVQSLARKNAPAKKSRSLSDVMLHPRDKDAARDYDAEKVDFEASFNRFNPFLVCQVLYVTAFLLAAAAWLGWTVPLNRSAFWLTALTLVVHTAALVSRVYISGRPPVTNLYSAAVFIGWGAAVLGLVLEAIFKLGIGNVVAAVAGFTTLLIASFLGADGDTFTVLQAVLDTQFWLATHVVCITLGYTTTFVAGMLGLIYVLRGVFTRSLTDDVRRDLTRMIYGVLCFAIFFSFVGTVLGGLWADDSWGRFWGWDPKENGALIIVLWNALVLHARWDGMIKDRGLAVLAIAGNIAVGWSMFGVNELGAGLHSYGFTEGIALALALFVISQLAVIGIGLTPKRLWRSNAAA